MSNDTVSASATGLPNSGLDADQRPATAEYWAGLNFEPWTHSDDEWTPPNNEEWDQIKKTHLITVRLAWALLYRTKAELTESLQSVDDDLGRELAENFRTAIHFFESTAQILKLAEARILCAGSVLEVEDEQGGEDADEN